MAEKFIPVMNLLQNSGQLGIIMVFKVHLSGDRGYQKGEGPQVDHGLTWGLLKFPRFFGWSQKFQSNFEHMEEENEWLSLLAAKAAPEGGQGQLRRLEVPQWPRKSLLSKPVTTLKIPQIWSTYCHGSWNCFALSLYSVVKLTGLLELFNLLLYFYALLFYLEAEQLFYILELC